ncbi:MAG: VOC family protein [Calditrichaeota bacterium]|nr:MAG: VOC family protein [Calditrichota bacterium]
MAVNYKPNGYQNVIPYMVVKDLEQLVEFFKKGFDAELNEYVPDGTGNVNHAEVTIGDSKIMIGRARENHPPLPMMLYIYVKDCKATYKKCLEASGESLMEPQKEFYGDMTAGVKEPQGNSLWIATHVEEISEEEMKKRLAAHKPKKL